MNMLPTPAVVKQSENNVPYLSLRPCETRVAYGADEFGKPVEGNGAHGNTSTGGNLSWHDWVGPHRDTTNDPSGLSSTVLSKIWNEARNDPVLFRNIITLMPRTEYDQHPWNSEKDKKYATNLTFKMPVGYPNTEGGKYRTSNDDPLSATGETAEELQDPSVVYDPHYVQLYVDSYIEKNGGDAEAALDAWNDDHHKYWLRDHQTPYQHYQGGWADTTNNGPQYVWGLIFRVVFDESATQETGSTDGIWWDNWHQNEIGTHDDSVRSQVMCIGIEKTASMSEGGNNTIRLFIAEMTAATGEGTSGQNSNYGSASWTYADDWAARPCRFSNKTFINTNLANYVNTDTHTLQVRTQGQAVSVYFDGEEQATYANVREILPRVGGDSSPNSTNASYSHNVLLRVGGGCRSCAYKRG